MDSNAYYTKLRRIAEEYGYDAQSRQCIEEMAELTQAINKFWRKDLKCGQLTTLEVPIGSTQELSIIEEIADVEICLAQMKYLLAIREEDINKVIEQKLDRQLERIEKCTNS